MPKKSIYVTAPSLATREKFVSLLKEPWESGILTHNGPLVQELERRLSGLLGLPEIVSVTNGTIGLQLAIKALEIEGEIITTPFSWIATCSAIKWQGCTPVFVDVDPKTFNIDPSQIEAAITPQTRAIMPVHVFSNPCDVDAIDKIAAKHGLKVIYDAAHAFGVNFKNRSLLSYGDASAISFHATKLFNTGEGGACYAPNKQVMERIRRIRFFGHNENKDISHDGLNGKLTEIHAALGLANIELIDTTARHREQIYTTYFDALSNVKQISFQEFDSNSYNYSYMPILFETETQLVQVQKKLEVENIYCRRYFYPSLNTVSAVRAYQACPQSESLAKRILCLPSHDRLSLEEVEEIANLITKELTYESRTR
jgi:dTDP-4-amino-4,6-dideoxygalactose transaminase